MRDIRDLKVTHHFSPIFSDFFFKLFSTDLPFSGEGVRGDVREAGARHRHPAPYGDQGVAITSKGPHSPKGGGWVWQAQIAQPLAGPSSAGGRPRVVGDALLGILEVCLNQFGPQAERKCALIDRNRDLYLCSVTNKAQMYKLATMVRALRVRKVFLNQQAKKKSHTSKDFFAM